MADFEVITIPLNLPHDEATAFTRARHGRPKRPADSRTRCPSHASPSAISFRCAPILRTLSADRSTGAC
jgi:hypothetical protein